MQAGVSKVGSGGVQETDMEADFLSLGMDIIGLGVFNYDFRSLTTESPVIKVMSWHLSSACTWVQQHCERR